MVSSVKEVSYGMQEGYALGVPSTALTLYNGTDICSACGGTISPVVAMYANACVDCQRQKNEELVQNRMVA